MLPSPNPSSSAPFFMPSAHSPAPAHSDGLAYQVVTIVSILVLLGSLWAF
jgi:hypothetical protein